MLLDHREVVIKHPLNHVVFARVAGLSSSWALPIILNLTFLAGFSRGVEYANTPEK